MKVLEVISSLELFGGGEAFAVNFSRELSSLVDLKVVILHKNNQSFFIDRLNKKGIEPVIFDKKGHVDLKNVKQLKDIIESFKPDVIHTETNALISTFLALKRTKYKNNVFVFHTMHLVPEKECNNLLVRIMYKHIFKKQNYIPVAITEKLSTISSNYYKKSFVPVVYNGTDLENYSNNIPLADRKFDVTVVGRFSPEKNHQFLIHSFVELIKNIPNLKIAFVGDGPLLQDMKKLSNDLNVHKNIVFKGALIDPSEVVNDSKIIALGSFYEANPLSLIEGMASGCIVVSSNVGGVSDIVKNKNGFLYDVNNQKEFVDILKTILSDVKSFDYISSYNCLDSLNYSMKKCVCNYFALFNKQFKNLN